MNGSQCTEHGQVPPPSHPQEPEIPSFLSGRESGEAGEEWNEKALRGNYSVFGIQDGAGALQVFKDRPFPFPVSFQLPNSPPKARLEVRGLECVSLGQSQGRPRGSLPSGGFLRNSTLPFPVSRSHRSLTRGSFLHLQSKRPRPFSLAFSLPSFPTRKHLMILGSLG